jgi:hypothetical protein
MERPKNLTRQAATKKKDLNHEVLKLRSAAKPQPKTFTADDAEKARMYADLFHILSILFILSNSFDRMNGMNRIE